MSIQIGDKVKVLSPKLPDMTGVASERVGQVGEVINDYSAYTDEEFPYGVEFSTPDMRGETHCAFAADELEVVQ